MRYFPFGQTVLERHSLPRISYVYISFGDDLTYLDSAKIGIFGCELHGNCQQGVNVRSGQQEMSYCVGWVIRATLDGSVRKVRASNTCFRGQDGRTLVGRNYWDVLIDAPYPPWLVRPMGAYRCWP